MPTPSPAIEDKIAHAIHNIGHFQGRDLRYEAQNGNVTLHGTVGTYFQKQIAQEVARRVDGVQNVTNLLEVAWSDSMTTAAV